jgi:hypothetical protein
MRTAPRASTAFATLSPPEKLARLAAVYPRQGKAFAALLDFAWQHQRRLRRQRQQQLRREK